MECLNGIFCTNVKKFIQYSKGNADLESSYVAIDKAYSREAVVKRFKIIYDTYGGGKSIQQETEGDLRKKIFKSFVILMRERLILMLVIRVFCLVSEFTTPYMMGKVLGFASDIEEMKNDVKMTCYYYILAFILLHFLRILADAYYGHNFTILRIQFEMIIYDLINKKILKLSSTEKNTIISAEVTKIYSDELCSAFNFLIHVNQVWELPLSIVISLYYIYMQVNIFFIPGIVFIIALLAISYKIAVNITHTEEELFYPRVKRKEYELISLENIKSVKYFSCEKYLQDKIFSFRGIELGHMRFIKYLDAICVYSWAASPILLAFFSIFSYILSGRLINMEKFYTTVSLLNMTIHPLNVFPWIFSKLKASVQSFGKITTFLLRPETVSKGDYIHNIASFDTDTAVYIENVTIKHSEHSDFQLTITKDNPVVIKQGEIVLIYGSIGSGKTLLIQALLHEAHVKHISSSSKFYLKRGRISYVPSDLWTFHSSIKENVTITISHCDDQKYRTTITKCSLSQEIARMKDKDDTVLIQKGGNVSGGQKQRLNIARAIYNRPDIFIFDNSFSSIDRNIALEIFSNAILPLKEQGVTVILASNDPMWIDYSDSVLYLENLSVRKANKEELLHSSREDGKCEANGRSVSTTSVEVKENENQGGIEIVPEKINRVSLSTYLFYLKHCGYILFFIMIFCVLMMQFCRNSIEVWLANWIKSENLTIEQKYSLQARNAKIYLVLVVIHSIFTTGRAVIFAKTCLRGCQEIYDTLITKLFTAKLHFFATNDIGKLTNLLHHDITVIDTELPFEFNRLLAFSFSLFGSVAVIVTSNWNFLGLFILIGIYYVKLFDSYTPASRMINRLLKKCNESFLNYFYDSIEGRVVIRADKCEDAFVAKFNSLVETRFNAVYTESCLGKWLNIRLDLLAFSIYGLIMLTIGFCIYKDQLEVIGLLSLGLTYGLNITGSLSSFLPWIAYTEEKFTAVERVHEKIKEISDVYSAPSFSGRKKMPCDGCKADDEKIIKFVNVSLSYNCGNKQLDNISLEIGKGEKVAIIGPTGAGKTSILSALLNLYKIEEGKILIKGTNINEIAQEELHKNIIVVPKDYLIMEGSLKENIDIDNRCGEKSFMQFLQLFHEDLFSNRNEFQIFSDPQYKIESNGSNLSDGQRSLIQIFRGLLKRPAVLCMDESNADLDINTEKKVFDLVFKYFSPEITFIVISHKMSILTAFDKILVIESGKIVDSGSVKKILPCYSYLLK